MKTIKICILSLIFLIPLYQSSAFACPIGQKPCGVDGSACCKND